MSVVAVQSASQQSCGHEDVVSEPEQTPLPQPLTTVTDTELESVGVLLDVAVTVFVCDPAELALTVHDCVHDDPFAIFPHDCGFVEEVDKPLEKLAVMLTLLQFDPVPPQKAVEVNVNVSPVV